MNVYPGQYQTQLELERIVVTNRIQSLSSLREESGFGWSEQSLLQQSRTILYRIEQAQNRMANGEYGKCEICHTPIDLERLKIVPYAEHCVDCQRQMERRQLKEIYQFKRVQ